MFNEGCGVVSQILHVQRVFYVVSVADVNVVAFENCVMYAIIQEKICMFWR